MEEEIISFIDENKLSPFSNSRTSFSSNSKSIFKTKDARSVFTRLLSRISSNFHFADTPSLFNFFSLIEDLEEIKKRQEFFRAIPPGMSNDFFREIKKPRKSWSPQYEVIVVTEDDSTFMKLKEMGCPVKFLITESDVLSLQEADVVQVIDCDNFSMALERLPQSIFLNSIDDAYLERYLEMLSGWEENISVLKKFDLGGSINKLVSELDSLLYLIRNYEGKKLTREVAEEKLIEINESVSSKIKNMNFSGDSLMGVLSKGDLPTELKEIVDQEIKSSGVREDIFVRGIPVKLDEVEIERVLRDQEINQFINESEMIKKNSEKLKRVPESLGLLESFLVLYDFKAGISKWMSNVNNFPEISDEFIIKESGNFLLENPQKISFILNPKNRCSILTGANSGGKTTLLEHIIQIISCFQMGLPVNGFVKSPIFSDVYYFAKNKGSLNKGAFETLLTQMSQIRSGGRTLILADEIEAVTEPGVAGRMISATVEYFISRGCYLVIATHLGQEIHKYLPRFTRIDGIEAKGLTEDNELIVDHNPVLGRLAHSTPELIIERMAKVSGEEYFKFLYNYMGRGSLET